MEKWLPNHRVLPGAEQIAEWRVERPSTVSPDLLAYGRCPRCTHECQVPLPLEIAGDAQAADVEPPAVPGTRKFPCTCTTAHDGRPADVRGGCGAFFLATVEPHDAGRWALTLDGVDEGMVPALDALDEAVRDEVSRVRGTAEKWLPGIAAVYGLFGLAGVAVGKDAVAALSVPGKVAVALLLVGGSVLAVISIVFGYRAAFGWLSAIDVSTADKIRDWYASRRAASLASPGHLRTSLGAALGALGCLVAAVLVIWFAPAAPGKVEITFTQAGGGRAVLCGELAAIDGDGVDLVVPEQAGSGTRTIAVADVIKAVSVPDCR